jgi:rod shape-determining protein MreC
MNAISATRRTIRREWTAFGVLLIISVGLMGVSGTHTALQLQSAVNSAVSPVETVLTDVTNSLGTYWSALTQIDHLSTENERLKQENLTLQEELDRMGAISKINDDWSKVTAAAQGVPYLTTPVQVIVRSISDVTQRTLVINKGTRDGLAKGQVVIDAGHALVGRITAVNATVSTVLLISDPSAVVIGKEAKTGATGTVIGTVGGALQLKYVDVASTLTIGDPVVTAGESLPGTGDTSPFPPGLLIGTITQVNSARNQVVQSATVDPIAHLEDATYLLVILDYTGGFGPPIVTCGTAPSIAPASPTPRPSKTPVSSATPAITPAPAPTCVPAATLPPLILPSATPTHKPTAKPKVTPTPANGGY